MVHAAMQHFMQYSAFWIACLMVKFRMDVKLLDVMMQYEIFGFCRLGL